MLLFVDVEAFVMLMFVVEFTHKGIEHASNVAD